MNPQRILNLLEKVKKRKVLPKQALESLKKLPFENLGFANVDHHRHLRKGYAEVIYAPGKTVEQIIKIAQSIKAKGSEVFITRAEADIYKSVAKVFPKAEYNPIAKGIVIRTSAKKRKKVGQILVISAGTADLPVAEEAAMTAEVLGNQVQRVYDVGVAGIHRFLAHWEKIQKAKVIIVVAGMEGALASVVGGLVDKPVIAVPTSVGYGASFGGLGALLTMLNSCASGITVVNIDNGFGAGLAASLISQVGSKK
ncbi:MAG: 1-(5-phosphoribosyl)-5-amino-4-imidazole-carboxylate carboxylase [candidate division Zixibacteria bacterium RBG_16_40_9]|nr:MAG: 1-(5-phosphoribosyl)-5-amino-4-imidazole-carboxylate carboxylase [candidate division Zixibacteria bacterium RBG_16_40_9]